jgi:hypothetical protein
MVQPPQRHGQGGSPPMMLGYSQPHASCVPVAGRRMFTITHTDLAADMLQQLPRTEGIHWDGTGEPFSKANESGGRGSDLTLQEVGTKRLAPIQGTARGDVRGTGNAT